MTPLHYAAQRSTAECASMLLNAGAPMGFIDFTTRSLPLHVAAKNGNGPVVEVLLDLLEKRGGKTEALGALDRWNRTPLHWSIANGHAPLCRMLLAGKAAPNLEINRDKMPKRSKRSLDRSYETPLELASRSYNEDGGEFGVLLRAALSEAARPRELAAAMTGVSAEF